MANTQITLQLSEGVIVPSAGSVAVVQGDSVTFLNPGTSPVTLFFSPAASAALSPTPSVGTTVAPGGQHELAFTTSTAGPYSVFFGAPGAPAPTVFPTDPSTVLSLQVADTGVSFGGYNVKPTTGG